MKKLLVMCVVAALLSAPAAWGIDLEKKDYLKLIVGNYVHGFKEFDTSVTTFESSVSVGIYYDNSTQARGQANRLADRFRDQLLRMLGQYPWAEDVRVLVNVYSEDRTGRGDE